LTRRGRSATFKASEWLSVGEILDPYSIRLRIIVRRSCLGEARSHEVVLTRSKLELSIAAYRAGNGALSTLVGDWPRGNRGL
jgi:hypothetical protein